MRCVNGHRDMLCAINIWVGVNQIIDIQERVWDFLLVGNFYIMSNNNMHLRKL